MVRSLASSGRCQPSSTTDTVPRGLRITSTKLALFDYERHFFNVQRFSTLDVEKQRRLHTTRGLLCTDGRSVKKCAKCGTRSCAPLPVSPARVGLGKWNPTS